MEEAIEEDDEDDLTPTHWAMLDVKAMKVIISKFFWFLYFFFSPYIPNCLIVGS